MQVQVKDESGLPIVAVAGEVGHENRDLLLDALMGLISRGASRIVLDMTEVPYLDSGGLSVIFTAIRRLPADGWLGVVGSSPDVQRLFQICGLLRQPRFHVFPTRHDIDLAVASAAVTLGVSSGAVGGASSGVSSLSAAGRREGLTRGLDGASGGGNGCGASIWHPAERQDE